MKKVITMFLLCISLHSIGQKVTVDKDGNYHSIKIEDKKSDKVYIDDKGESYYFCKRKAGYNRKMGSCKGGCRKKEYSDRTAGTIYQGIAVSKSIRGASAVRRAAVIHRKGTGSYTIPTSVAKTEDSG